MNGFPLEHIPVLARTLAEQINLPQDAVMVDATVGQGGHSLLFGQNFNRNGLIVGLDVDEKSIAQAADRLKDLRCRVILVRSNFSRIAEVLIEQGIERADFILADLGVSSMQLADSAMGLSFQKNMPLDMRMDKRLKTTAADIVNKTDEKSLANLIYNFGQDRASRRIARFIVKSRTAGPITTTAELSSIVCRALGRAAKGRRSRIHPATRTFQALRIAVNRELENLERLLFSAPELLVKDGQIAVISFHSLEDRIVKLNFRENEKKGIYRLVTPKPLVPDAAEISENPRSRSAKLRIAQRQ